jgi:hypothetical protein
VAGGVAESVADGLDEVNQVWPQLTVMGRLAVVHLVRELTGVDDDEA